MMAARAPLVVVFSGMLELPGCVIGKMRHRSLNMKSVGIPQPGSQLDADSLTTLQSAEIILGDPGPIAALGLTHNLPALKWLQSTWAGADSLMRSLDKTKPHPEYQFTRFSGYFDQLIGEYVIGSIISHQRSFRTMAEQQKQKIWDLSTCRVYRPLSEMTLLVLGLGDIGKAIARYGKGFGMTVNALVRNIPEADSPMKGYIDDFSTIEELPRLLKKCDYICSILPSTVKTVGLLNGDLLSHCKNNKPVFINVGRGDVVDEEVLIRALDEGWLGHVVLDVFKEEPLPQQSPLWLHPKVTITPHVAGVSLPHQMAEMFMNNYERYLKGEPLLHLVNWEAGY